MGIPFLMLTVGQVLGSAIAGNLIDNLNYDSTFVIYGLIGLLALVIYPSVDVKPGKVEENQITLKCKK